MRLARLGPPGAEVPVVLVGDRAFDLRPLTADVDGPFLAGDGPRRIPSALESGLLQELPDAATQRIGPPIARPSAVYCIGMNYAAHAAESGSAPPEHLVMFLKSPNTIGGPDDAVTVPDGSHRTDWEVELGVVIGRRAHQLGSRAAAREHIAGYVLANDLSERQWQIDLSGGQWSKGKSAPGFLPLGPWLVTPDEVDAADLGLRSWVNGEPRQDSRSSDMIVDVEDIVVDLSSYVALEPGDLILTGTPEGVGLSGRFPYLQPGDSVRLEIDGLGRQEQLYVAAGNQPAPSRVSSAVGTEA